MIYLDNSSSTLKKPSFIKRTLKLYLKKYTANPGRSGHNLSLQSADQVLIARTTLSDYFGLDKPENVIFTSSCTESINLALLGTYKPNGHIIATIYEHNSVLRTLNELKTRYNITYTLVTPNKYGQITLDSIEKEIKPSTYLVVVNHTSNVIGHTQNIHTIGQLCVSKKLLFMVDSAQSGGHEHIDMSKDNINLLAVAGHKGFLSIQCGALLIKDTIVSPMKYGGTGTNSLSVIQPEDYPEGLESGTLQVANIMCLSSAVKYNQKHFYSIQKKIKKLSLYLLSKLKMNTNIKVYSNNLNSGVISIEVIGVPSTDISSMLNDEYKICVRSGLHCAPMIHSYLHTTDRGLVRISLTHQNSMHDIKCLLNALNKITSRL